MSNLTAFNNQLENFICFLEKTFPDNMNVKTYHNSISMLRKVNPRKIVDFFNKYIYVYKEQIMNNDAKFFIDRDYGEELCGDNESMLEAISFKEMWNSSSSDVHCQIFRYFKLLCLLSEKC